VGNPHVANTGSPWSQSHICRRLPNAIQSLLATAPHGLVVQNLSSPASSHGGNWSSGGTALGGGIGIEPGCAATINNSVIAGNLALGGQGIGGGVYNDLGTFNEDLLNVLAHNLASTSHNNIFSM
jgi:hypothetical protein